MNKLLEYINSFVSIDKEQETVIKQYFSHKKYTKGTVLIESDSVCDKLYFINSGYLRTFYYRDNKEVTNWIYSEGDLVTIPRSFYTKKPSNEGIEAITDLSVCYIRKSDLERFYQIPKMNEFGRQMLEQCIVGLDETYQHIFTATAEEKYNYLAITRPDLIQNVNLGYISSLLGIRQETLSRIGKKSNKN